MNKSICNFFLFIILLVLAVLFFGCEKNKINANPCSQIVKSDCEVVFDGEQYAIRRIKDQLFWSHDGLIWAKEMPILFRDSCQAKRQLLEWIEVNREFKKQRTFKPI